MMKIIGGLLALTVLVACDTSQEGIDTTVTVNNLDTSVIITPPRPASVNPLPVEWQVLTTERLIEMVNEPDFELRSIVLYAVTVEGYENLALTLDDLLRYIEQQNEIILYYETVVN